MGMYHLFAGVKWTCTACGAAAGTCNCWEKCECGRSYLRGTECPNAIWHVARELAEDAAAQVVEDMAQSYKLFRREYMAERLKRAVVRQTQPVIIAAFEGVEEVKRGKTTG